MSIKPHDSEAKRKEIAQRLAVIRKSVRDKDGNPLSGAAFARLINVGYKTYGSWETGHRRIPPEWAELIADKFGVTMDFIYRGSLWHLPEHIIKAAAMRDNL